MTKKCKKRENKPIAAEKRLCAQETGTISSTTTQDSATADSTKANGTQLSSKTVSKNIPEADLGSEDDEIAPALVEELLPPGVNDIIQAHAVNAAGDGYDLEDHDVKINEGAQYLLKLLPHAHSSKLVKKRIRQLLGLGWYFPENLMGAGAWDGLKAGCAKLVDDIGSELEVREFNGKDLAAVLGQCSPKIRGGPENANAIVRQSVIPSQCGPSRFRSSNIVAEIELEYTYIHFVRLLATALNTPFQVCCSAQ